MPFRNELLFISEFICSNRMKNVIVYGVYVVGMHRPCELEVGTPFFCKREHDNPVDKNA